jgi:hypothetical protein
MTRPTIRFTTNLPLLGCGTDGTGRSSMSHPRRRA